MEPMTSLATVGEPALQMLGLYPTWYEPVVGSGWVVAIIATIHVLASHTSVGAAIFFAYLATRAYRDNRPELLDYIKKYGLFLLVFSYVLGSITGPGIWFSTTVASPRGISALIHSFVWKWATEWVFFVIEVIGVYMLIYLVGKVNQRTHLTIAWIFGLASYGTMLIIIGILSFMLWPGKEAWFMEGGYLNGFYGANTFAQLAMRTAFMFTMTAVVGGIVAASIKDLAFKAEITRKLSFLGISATLIGAALFAWYLQTLPDTAHVIMENRLPDYFVPSLLAVLGGILAWFVFTALQPRALVTWAASVATIAILVFGLWPEEVARESIRKPWVAGQYLYSNQVVGRDVPGVNVESELPRIEAHGLLKTHAFLPENLRQITPDTIERVGHAIALTMCSNCHSLSASGMRPIRRYFGDNTDYPQIAQYLKSVLATGNTLYMPAMPLKDEEFEALALYIATLEDPNVAENYRQQHSNVALNNAASSQSGLEQ